jgi:hypothetical protein
MYMYDMCCANMGNVYLKNIKLNNNDGQYYQLQQHGPLLYFLEKLFIFDSLLWTFSTLLTC